MTSEWPAKTEAEAAAAHIEAARARPPLQFRIRTGMMAVLLAGVWFWLLLIPGLGALMLLPLIFGLFALGVMAAAMLLGGFGILVCGAVEWLLAKSNRPPEWFHPDPPEAKQFWPSASNMDAARKPFDETAK